MQPLTIPTELEIERELASRSLHDYIKLAWDQVQPVPYVDGYHIGLECEYLEAFVDGEIPRLLINIPPGHMKSIASCVMLPTWVWGPRGLPAKRFVNTSYRENLAIRDADASRELIRSKWYTDRWGHQFKIKSDQVKRYSNTAGGYRFSCPVSGIMGEGGDFVILDDPHNVEVAESDGVRDETVRKLNLALPTRVRSKDGGVLVIMQRLHSKDYAGSMIASELDLVHLCLPARFEYDHPHVTLPTRLPSGRQLPGDQRADPKIMKRYQAAKEAGDKETAAKVAAEHNGAILWPENKPESELRKIEVPLGTYGSAGQLQQRPVPREGGLFKRAWFDEAFVDSADLPRRRIVVRGWDLAGSKSSTSPYTAGVRMSWWLGIYYVEHVVRERGSPGDVEKLIKSTARSDGSTVIIDVPQDPGQAGKGQVQAFARLLAGWSMRSSPESGSKEARADPLSAQAQAGNVKIVRGSWNDAYLDEVCLFPGGDYADQVDASSRAFARLLSLGGRVSSGVSSGSY